MKIKKFLPFKTKYTGHNGSEIANEIESRFKKGLYKDVQQELDLPNPEFQRLVYQNVNYWHEFGTKGQENPLKEANNQERRRGGGWKRIGETTINLFNHLGKMKK